jgi:hypothetical protein
MAMVEEKDIRGYRVKGGGIVCPLCATDEERADSASEVVAEDVIHNDPGLMECVRCRKVVK